MKRIIRLTESDLTRIVRRVIKEQSIDYNFIETRMSPKELADLIYSSLDNVFSDLDRGTETKKEYLGKNGAVGEYRLIRNAKKEMPKDYSTLDIYQWGNAEAPVEAAFLNMSIPLKKVGSCPECWAKFNEVSKLYKQRFNRDLMKDVKEEIDIYKIYHKKSIASIISSWGTPY